MDKMHMSHSKPEQADVLKELIRREEWDRFTEIGNMKALYKDITKLIKPWFGTAAKPPFTASELAIFAIIVSGEHLDVEDIRLWILKHFRYYALRAVREYSKQMLEEEYAMVVRPDEVIEDFPGGLQLFDVPLVLKHNKEEGECCFPMSRCYSITTAAARIVLRRWLEPARTGKFRFLDLSAELRNKIYEMVFKFPKTGLTLREYGGLGVPVHAERGCTGSTEKVFECDGEDCYLADVGPLNNLLAPLRANKQVFQEGVSQFYGINLFNVGDLRAASRLLPRMPLAVTKRIQRLHINMWGPHYLATVAELLPNFAPKNLGFTMESSEEWLKSHNYNLRYEDDRVRKEERKEKQKKRMRPRKALQDSFEKIPELKEFVALARRAEKVTVYGDPDGRFEAFLMAEPKVAVKKKK